MKKVFVTGSNGMLGSSLIRSLKNKYNLKLLSNNKKITKKNYINYSSKKNINEFIIKNGIPDYFLHLGWGKMTDPHSSYHLNENYLNSKNLLEIFYNKGLRNFIFIGTINEYGSNKGVVTEDNLLRINLRNYEKGKIKFANYGKKLADKKNKYFIHIRLANLYGPLQKKNSLIYSIHEAYRKDAELKLSPLNIYRDYLFSEEAAVGIIKIMNKVNETLTINLGSGKNISMRYFVKKYWNYIGGEKDKLKFGSLIKSKNDPAASKFYLSLKLLKKTTGWCPENDLRQNIKKNIKLFNISNE